MTGSASRESSRHPFRDNVFLLAAVALPIVVGVFFLIASRVPVWTVDPPAYDIVIKVPETYTSPPVVSVDFEVRNDRVEARLRPVPPNTYRQRWVVLLVDHRTLKARNVTPELPDRLAEDETDRTIPVPALADLMVSPDATAPDGYALRTRSGGGPGLVGELFGMRSRREHVVLVGHGRTVRIELPAPFAEPYQPVEAVGWVTPVGR